MTEWRNKETLERLYFEEKLSQKEIADKLGCNQSTICKWMDNHGIESRPRPLATSMSLGPISLKTNERGYELFQSRSNYDRCVVAHHRLLMAAEHGLDVIKGKVVHHKNEIPWDNRLENLKLMTDSEHKTHHAQELWERDSYRDSQTKNTTNDGEVV